VEQKDRILRSVREKRQGFTRVNHIPCPSSVERDFYGVNLVGRTPRTPKSVKIGGNPSVKMIPKASLMIWGVDLGSLGLEKP
jgi:hypothetical protein